nr:hypothetical protein [Kibdelosporangium sp. MJ126-NF4]CTQ93361.1 hypothetical protein [Kibdelosporangium sp. MJ126-NF4]
MSTIEVRELFGPRRKAAGERAGGESDRTTHANPQWWTREVTLESETVWLESSRSRW